MKNQPPSSLEDYADRAEMLQYVASEANKRVTLYVIGKFLSAVIMIVIMLMASRGWLSGVAIFMCAYMALRCSQGAGYWMGWSDRHKGKLTDNAWMWPKGYKR